jgi:hypothetical protein
MFVCAALWEPIASHVFLQQRATNAALAQAALAQQAATTRQRTLFGTLPVPAHGELVQPHVWVVHVVQTTC